MKKYIFTIVFLLAVFFNAAGQRFTYKGKGIELGAGVLSGKDPDKNYYASIGLIVNGRSGNYQLWSMEYSYRHYEYRQVQLPHQTYTIEGGYSFYLFGNAGRSITFNSAITAVVGYESINNGTTELFDGSRILDKDGLIYGVGGRFSLEFYISDRIVLLLQGKAKVFWGTSLDQIRLGSGIGIRYNL